MAAGSAPPAKTITLVVDASVIAVRSKRQKTILSESQNICSDSNGRSNRKHRLWNPTRKTAIKRFKLLRLHLWQLIRLKAKRTSLMRSELETGFVWSALIWTSHSGWPATGVSETEPQGPVSSKTRMSFKSSNLLDAQPSTFAPTPRVSTVMLPVSSLARVTSLAKQTSLLQPKLLVPCQFKIGPKSRASFVDCQINPKWVSQEAMSLTQSKKSNYSASECWKSVPGELPHKNWAGTIR